MLFLTAAQLERARTDRAYPRGRIHARLEKVCARHLETTPEHLRGLSPFRNQMVWNGFINDLSMMYAVTGDARYLDRVLVFVRAIARDEWRTVEMTEHLHAPFVFTALAGLADLHGPDLAGDDLGLLRETMVSVAEYLWDELHHGDWGSRERTVWNHNPIAYATIGVAGLVLDDHPLADEWREVGIERCRLFLDVGVTPAGMTWEGHHYCGYVFKQLGLFLQALRARNLESEVVPAGSVLATKMRQVPVWYAHDLFPGGRWLQNYNDSHWDPHSALLGFLLSFVPYEPEVAAAVWHHLVGAPGLRTFGSDPRFSSLSEAMTWFPSEPIRPLHELTQLGDHFFCPDAGYLAARTGWDDHASVFTFNSGPLVGRIHDHADNNSFTFVAAGNPIVIDSGTGNDRREGSPSSSHGHNVVFIDGLGEGIAGAGAGVSGAIVGVRHRDDHVAVTGDATSSYATREYNPVRHAIRHVVFVKRPVPYVITYDDVDKDGREHRYEYLLHVPSGGSGDPADPVDGLAIATVDGEPAGGRVRLLQPLGAHANSEPFVLKARPKGPYNEHATWWLEARAVNPHFVVLLLPASSEAEPVVEVRRETSTVVVRLQWPYGVDEVSFVSAGQRGDVVRLPSLVRTGQIG